MKTLPIGVLLAILSLNMSMAQTLDWVRGYGGFKSYNAGWTIATNKNGDVYTIGYFQDTVDFNPGSGIFNLITDGSFDIYIQKLDVNGNFVWAKRFGGPGCDIGLSLVLDHLGNIYTTGFFADTVDFDPGTGVSQLIGEVNGDVFIMKLDANGDFLWVKGMGGSHADQGWCIDLDLSENIYIAGTFLDTVDFDPGIGVSTKISSGSQDCFIQKLDNDGNFIWVKTMGGKAYDELKSIEVDDFGNVYSTGGFNDTADFDPGAGVYNLISIKDYDIFVQKLDSNGDFVWAKRFGGIGNDLVYSIALDGLNNVYTTGYFLDTVDFNPGAGIYNLSARSSDIYINKLDSNGDFVWAKKMGGSGYDLGISVTTDSFDNVYSTGYFSDTADFDPGTANHFLIAKKGSYIQKLDSAGNYIWAKGVDNSEGNAIIVEPSGNIYTMGEYWDTAVFDPGNGNNTLIGNGYNDIFIQRIIQNSLGFPTLQKLSSALYPNPNNGSFTLEINTFSDKYQNYQLEVYSVMGALVYSEQLKIAESICKKMNLEYLSKGLYFIKLKSKKSVFNFRFVLN